MKAKNQAMWGYLGVLCLLEKERELGLAKLGEVGNCSKNWFFISNSWEGFGIFLSYL